MAASERKVTCSFEESMPFSFKNGLLAITFRISFDVLTMTSVSNPKDWKIVLPIRFERVAEFSGAV